MDFVFECDDFLTKEYCEIIIKKVESKGTTVPGLISGERQPHIKKGDDIYLTRDFNLWQKEIRFLDIKIKEVADRYKKHLIDNKLYHKLEVDNFFRDMKLNLPQIQQTKTGEFYRWHVDSTVKGCKRVLTYIIYLNDMNEENGGSTDFLNKSIKPKAGKLVIFPATWTYIHRGKRVEKGTKYILSGFGYLNVV